MTHNVFTDKKSSDQYSEEEIWHIFYDLVIVYHAVYIHWNKPGAEPEKHPRQSKQRDSFNKNILFRDVIQHYVTQIIYQTQLKKHRKIPVSEFEII